MTQTNGMAQEMPTLAALLEVVEKIERDTYKVPVEYKIHPDDFMELKRQVSPHMVKIDGRRPVEIMGLRIVLDYSAERLPRKVPNAIELSRATLKQHKTDAA